MLMREGSNTSGGTTKDEGVDAIGAFIGVDGFQVHDVTDDVEFIRDTISTEHFTGTTSDVDGFHARIALEK